MMFNRVFKISKRKAVATAFAYSQLFTLSKPFASDGLTIFNFHRIASSENHHPLFDDTLFGPDEHSFRQHLKWMKRHADPISEEDLIGFVQDRRPLPRRSFMITFDDGYRDNFELALPILRELNVPAIFFIPTQAIEERTLGWWDHIYWALKQTTRSAIHVRGNTYKLQQQPLLSLAEIFTNKLKSGSDKENKTLIEELRAACDVSPPPFELCDREMMTWEQIRHADKQGIAIGSHTHTHRVLSCLTLADQRVELSKSKQILETKLGKKVKSIAYPVGGYEHFNTETTALSKECGYDLAFSFLTGINKIDFINALDIKRIYYQLDQAVYAGVFNMPWLFAKRTCSISAPQPCANESNLLNEQPI